MVKTIIFQDNEHEYIGPKIDGFYPWICKEFGENAGNPEALILKISENQEKDFVPFHVEFSDILVFGKYIPFSPMTSSILSRILSSGFFQLYAKFGETLVPLVKSEENLHKLLEGVFSLGLDSVRLRLILGRS